MDTNILNEIKNIKENKGNFQTIKKDIGEEKLKEFLISIYPKFSITEIEAITGIPDSTIDRWLKNLDIPTTRSHIRNYSVPGNIDSQIIVTENNKVKKLSTIKITPELAYIIGFSLGDGNIERYQVTAFNQNKQLREPILNFLKLSGYVGESQREDGLWKLKLSNVKIADLIKDENGKIRKDTLDYIFNDLTLAKQFVSAFWDAEGTVRPQGKYYHVYLYNSNEYLIDKIAVFLKSKNINLSKLTTPPDKKRIYFLNGRKIESKKALHRLSVPKSSYQNWINEIGIHLLHSEKKSVVNKMIKNIIGGK